MHQLSEYSQDIALDHEAHAENKNVRAVAESSKRHGIVTKQIQQGEVHRYHVLCKQGVFIKFSSPE